MRISDWSSDVCSSDLFAIQLARRRDGTSIERHETTACEPPAIAGSDQPVLIAAEAAGQILLVAEPQLLGHRPAGMCGIAVHIDDAGCAGLDNELNRRQG